MAVLPEMWSPFQNTLEIKIIKKIIKKYAYLYKIDTNLLCLLVANYKVFGAKTPEIGP